MDQQDEQQDRRHQGVFHSWTVSAVSTLFLLLLTYGVYASFPQRVMWLAEGRGNEETIRASSVKEVVEENRGTASVSNLSLASCQSRLTALNISLNLEKEMVQRLNGSLDVLSLKLISYQGSKGGSLGEETSSTNDLFNSCLADLSALKKTLTLCETQSSAFNRSLHSCLLKEKILELEGQQLKTLEELKEGQNESGARLKKLEDNIECSWTSRLARGEYDLRKPHPIRAGVPASWSQRSFVPHGSYGFVQYSAYRMGKDRIAIMGMADVHTMSVQSMGPCVWHAADGTIISGKLSSLYENHHEGAQYTAETLTCRLENATGANGGYLVGRVDAEDIVMFREEPGQLQDAPDEFQYNLSFCSGPLHGEQDISAFREWLNYHRIYAETQHFTFYNVDSLNGELRQLLQPHIDTGLIEIVELENMMSFDFFYFGQMLMLYDCIGSMALRTKWVYFLDIDEYLEAVPPASVSSILQQHASKSWITHGAFWWDITKCVDSASDGLALEKMVFRRPQLYCFEEPKPPNTRALCIEWKGHRKLIVNPRKVHMVQVHMVVIWDGEGVDLRADTELRHNHFRKLNVKEEGRNCRQMFSHTDFPEGTPVEDGGWVRDDRLARLIPEIKKSPLLI